jgi:hypothetical protein
MAVAACMSFSNSMKAIPGRASTMRTWGEGWQGVWGGVGTEGWSVLGGGGGRGSAGKEMRQAVECGKAGGNAQCMSSRQGAGDGAWSLWDRGENAGGGTKKGPGGATHHVYGV